MRIGTRGSALALAQSGHVRERLANGGADEVPLEVIETSGDRNPMASLRRFGGKGIFTKEIEEALLLGRVDLAVHSLKDLPTEMTAGLTIGALLTREDPRDAVIARGGVPLEKLPRGSKVGTSSLRRRAQLLARRPDLEVVDLRGNVPTRIARLEEGRFDAIVIAAAGLRRLGLIDRATELLEDSFMLPAPGQGVVAIQIRDGDAKTASAVSSLHDSGAAAEAAAERSLLAALGGGCLVPIGARARVADGSLTLAGFVGDPSGRPALRRTARGPAADPEAVGRELAGMFLHEGARSILDKARGDESFP
ncbi:MAG: hydroxymethylbilane synthase [Bacteroidota bacterium]